MEAVLGEFWPIFTSCVVGCDRFFDPDAGLEFDNEMMSYNDGQHIKLRLSLP